MGKINLRNRLRDSSDDDINQSNTNKINEPTTQNNFYENISPKNNFNDSQYDTSKKENIRKKNEDLFKEPEEESAKGFTGLLRGTKKLFTKKLDSMKISKNLIGNLNVNKRMLYIALGTSSVAGILVLNYLNGFNTTGINVLIATKELKEKTIISSRDLRVAKIPREYLVPNAIIIESQEDIKKWVGKIAIVDIGANEQLTERRIIANEKINVIPENHRAFDIPTRNMSYLRPTERVDLLVSVPNPLDRKKMINTPILQNTLVLAVDGKFKIYSGESTPGDSVMVAVPNEFINLFSSLQQKGGVFRVILRGSDDESNLEELISIDKLEVMFSDKDVNQKIKIFSYPTPRATPRPTKKPIINHTPRARTTAIPIKIKSTPRPTAKPTPQPTPKPKTVTVTIISNGKQKRTVVEKKEEKNDTNKGEK